MPKASLTSIDLTIIGLYIIAILAMGFVLGRKQRDPQAYFLAGRNMTWFVIGISLFASNISSTTLIGLAGTSYQSGIAVYNYEWMAAVVLILLAIFVFPLYLKSGVFTIPEYLERRYDARFRYYFSLLTLFLNIVVDTAGTLFAGGLVINMIFPQIPFWQCIAALALIAGIYTASGGLRAVMYTDVIQAVILILGSIILTWLALDKAGGWQQVLSTTSATDLKLILPANHPEMPWPGLLTGVFLLGFYFWGMNQFMTQRVLAARNINHARWGALLAGALKLTVLFIMVFPGLIARVLYPDLKTPDSVYPTMLFDLLPAGLLGLVLVGLLAAIMSSLDSTLNSASTLVTMDFVKKRHPEIDDRKLVRIGRITTILFMLLAVAWAPQILSFKSLFIYLQKILAYSVPAVVAVLILGLFSTRIKTQAVWIGLMMGTFIGIVLFVFNEVVHLTKIPFLYIPAVLFVVTTLFSLISNPMCYSTEVHRELTWNRHLLDRVDLLNRDLRWYQNFRLLAFLLIILLAIQLYFFW